jgi:hypothetical protein
MKKSHVVAALFSVFALLFTVNITAQKMPGLDKSPLDMAAFPSSYKVSDKAMRVIYSRPQLKERSLSKLAPAGAVWRTGANEAAEITFYKDVKFGGKAVKAGTYSLFTIPGDTEWTVILNSNLNQWGAYSYDESKDVARVSGAVSKNANSQEAFAMMFDEADGGAHLIMAWDKVKVTVPVSM